MNYGKNYSRCLFSLALSFRFDCFDSTSPHFGSKLKPNQAMYICCILYALFCSVLFCFALLCSKEGIDARTAAANGDAGAAAHGKGLVFAFQFAVRDCAAAAAENGVPAVEAAFRFVVSDLYPIPPTGCGLHQIAFVLLLL